MEEKRAEKPEDVFVCKKETSLEGNYSWEVVKEMGWEPLQLQEP